MDGTDACQKAQVPISARSGMWVSRCSGLTPIALVHTRNSRTLRFCSTDSTFATSEGGLPNFAAPARDWVIIVFEGD